MSLSNIDGELVWMWTKGTGQLQHIFQKELALLLIELVSLSFRDCCLRRIRTDVGHGQRQQFADVIVSSVMEIPHVLTVTDFSFESTDIHRRIHGSLVI